MSVKVEESNTWSEVRVDMPGVGSGAQKAGWWVVYLQDLAALGKVADLAHYLRMAEKSGAIHVINKAAEERLKNTIARRRYKSGFQQAVREVPTLPQNLGPGVKKVSPSDEKSEPYYYPHQWYKVG